MNLQLWEEMEFNHLIHTWNNRVSEIQNDFPRVNMLTYLFV